MHSAETPAITVGRGYITHGGHAEVAYIDDLGIGNYGVGVAVYCLAVPSLDIDILFGFLFFTEQYIHVVESFFKLYLFSDVLL